MYNKFHNHFQLHSLHTKKKKLNFSLYSHSISNFSSNGKGIWNGKIAQLHGKGSMFEVIMVNPLLCLKQLLHKTYEFGTHSLGVAGSNDDINVLNQSDVFTDVMQGRAPEVHFSVNRT